MHQQQWGFYFQDDIKLTRDITLNLGLRWERETAPLEETRQLVKTLDLTQPIPELQNVTMPSEVTAIAQVPYKFNGAMIYTSNKDPRMYSAPWKTFLPRAGIAIRINDKTAFRAGYARYALQWITIHPETGGLPTNGFSQSTNVLGPLQGVPRALLSDPFPATNPVVQPAGNSLGTLHRPGERRQLLGRQRHEDADQRPVQLHDPAAGASPDLHRGHLLHDVRPQRSGSQHVGRTL